MNINIIKKLPKRVKYALVKKNVYDISDDDFLNLIESLPVPEANKYLDLLVDKYNKKEASDNYIIRLIILSFEKLHFDEETNSGINKLKYKIKDKENALKAIFNYTSTDDAHLKYAKYFLLVYFAEILSSSQIRQVLESFSDYYVVEFLELNDKYIRVGDLNALLKMVKYNVRNIDTFIDNFSDEDLEDFIAFTFDFNAPTHLHEKAKKYILEHITRLKRDNFEKEKELSLLIKENINVIKSSDLLHLLSIFNYLDHYGDIYLVRCFKKSRILIK